MAARRKQASIAALLIVLLVSIATLVLVLFGAFDFATELRDQRGAVRMEETLLADQLAVSLALPVWNFDHDQIIAIMASLMKDADVFAVSVRLSDKRSSLHALVRNSQWAVVQTMRFESEEGLGTTVRVSFPVPGGETMSRIYPMDRFSLSTTRARPVLPSRPHSCCQASRM